VARRALLFGAVWAALLAAPALASAQLEMSFVSGTVRVWTTGPDADDVATIATSPGKVEVTNAPTDAVLSTLGGICVADGTHKVTCTSPGIERYDAIGGGGKDRLTVTGSLPGSLDGREGDDTLTGGAGTEAVIGGDGSDAMFAGPGDDRLDPDANPGTGEGNEVAEGGSGDDVFVVSHGEGGGDRYVGGTGTDKLVTIGLTGLDAVTANLASGALTKPTAPVETDTMREIEDIVTPWGPDSVTGSSGPDEIETALDRFVMTASPGVFPPLDGADTVDPGAGVDRVRTFAGNDRINSSDGFADFVDCGPGTDTVTGDAFDALVDCEAKTITTAGRDLRAPRCRISGVKSTVSSKAFFRGFNIRVGCDEAAGLLVQAVVRVRRSGRIRTAAAGELIVAEASRRLAGGTRRIKLRGSKRMRRSLGNRFTVRLRVEGTDAAKNRGTVTKRLKIRPAKRKRGR
jgi:Ca2+-binding RTX toxin-like protein